MFKNGDNQKIGTYLSDLIDEKYSSKRKFCIEYLKADGTDTTNENIQKMSNRISQIIKGNKAIQTYDLPIFTELLGVSCEQILTAGKYCVPLSKRVTNYSIASSKDPAEWEAFINREDKLILNQDEYCKTFLDYALEFGNYELLKYLIDKKYIWFDSKKDDDYAVNFGAGTSIERRNIQHIDSALQKELLSDIQLRLNLISLAVDQSDTDIFDELRAREIPQMYFSIMTTDIKFYEAYNSKMVNHISKSSEKIIDYFTDEFEIKAYPHRKDKEHLKYTFMFPFISELLDFLIENKSPYVKNALEKSIKHNNCAYKKICDLIKSAENADGFDADEWLKICQSDLSFVPNGNVIIFKAFRSYMHKDFVSHTYATNIAHTKKTSKDPIINHLIEKLNESYEKVKNLKDNLKEL